MEKDLFTSHLLAIGKLNYVHGERPAVDCIFCAVRDDDPRVTSLKVYHDATLFICLNLYPYNPGHLMIVPNQHEEQFENLSVEVRNHLFEVVAGCQRMLQTIFHPTGFNVGYNQGEYSGASIKHFHIHLVPRYKYELGYIDILGGTKIVVEPVSEVLTKIQSRIHSYLPSA